MTEELKSYEEFKEDIFDMVESVEIDSDDYYPPAIFMGTRESEGSVFYLEQISKEEEIEVSDLMTVAIPNVLRRFSADYFAIVAPTVIESDDGEGFEKLILAISDKITTEVFISKVQRGNIGNLFLDEWVECDPVDFSDMLAPLKRSICPQG